MNHETFSPYSLAKIVDGVILIVRQGKTTSDSLRSVCDHLEVVGSNVLGIIMNQVPMKAASDYYNRRDGWKQRVANLREKFSIKSFRNYKTL